MPKRRVTLELSPAAPLRRVVKIISEQRWSPGAGAYSLDFELLECGHQRTPKSNAFYGGTDLGDAQRRRCWKCAKGQAAEYCSLCTVPVATCHCALDEELAGELPRPWPEPQ